LRRKIAALIFATGLLLIGTAGALYLQALERQERDQAARDQHWARVQREAAKRRILPGEERPTPAQLPGRLCITGLFGSGIVLTTGGITTFIAGRKSIKR
jgi:hypothetical protein